MPTFLAKVVFSSCHVFRRIPLQFGVCYMRTHDTKIMMYIHACGIVAPPVEKNMVKEAIVRCFRDNKIIIIAYIFRD